MSKDIRWNQLFANYDKALNQLTKFIEKGDLNKLEEQGLVKAFEYTYELAWNVMKDYLEYQGKVNIIGSRDTFREAFQDGLIENGENWMSMIESRNKTSQIYNEETAIEITKIIVDVYYSNFLQLRNKLKSLSGGEHKSLFDS